MKLLWPTIPSLIKRRLDNFIEEIDIKLWPGLHPCRCSLTANGIEDFEYIGDDDMKQAKEGQQGLQTHINKGLTKHQAINAVHGAGQVKIKKAPK